ncbi:hypothetical protein A2818_00045 [Candidatus Nomurabacteria bacterium RIFCSPHIGHO2_01_FULL_40_12]|uniref:DNA polymerase III delta N-terminal domain-containing protein n=1 Tax=Candidatus Nomurabacteria bacterium RIFCSPHIGHO2_01_FULL_40_12 TaxID=1801737 RepID=A0A1F6V0P5_9BACT|nr:MAG: hypothetical protein A2818_00045 [Candidatus Nomurabacteria bacterium RIFCSPHIGHO2_01_FULL_40_12]
MIYLFAGDDAKNKHRAYREFLESISSGMETFFINRNNFNKTQLESLYSGSSLFFSQCAVIFENILEYEENRDFIFEQLDFLSKSSSSFVFLEGKLNKLILGTFKKVRAELNVFMLPKVQTEKFDNFLLANAFGQKDKLNLWIYFRQAMDKGVGMEELIGVLFWKAKDMLIKKDFRKFSATELQKSVSHLSYLLPEARKYGRDAESVFEQFLLEAF